MNKSMHREVIDGIDVIYLNVPYSNNMNVISRLRAFMSFMFKSCYYTFKEKQVDFIYATSTPLTVGLPALFAKWIKRIPYLFEVRDLWPEVPIQMGALKNKLIKNIAVLFEKTIYKNATHIIALSPGMQDGVYRFVKNKEKVSMIPNMSKIDEFFPRKILPIEKEKLNIDSKKFNCIHFGAMGIANGLEYIVEAAKFANENKINNINFVFLGEGKVEEKLKKFVKENALDNVSFLGAKPLKEVSKIVNACDLSIVSFANIEILKTNSPNKFFDSLSAGKPIIVNSAGWTKDIVEREKCGFYVDPTQPSELIEKIQKIESDDELIKRFSKNSRELAEKKYDKSILTPKIANLIESNV